MRTRLLLAAVALSLTLAALPAVASAQLAGEAQGVTIVNGKQGYVLRFDKRAAKTYHRIAGRRVEVRCETVSPSAGSLVVDGGSSTEVRAPRRRGGIRTLTRGRVDYCSVRLTSLGRQLVAEAPVTAAGRTYLDEVETVAVLLLPFDIDEPLAAPTTKMVAEGHGIIVALDGPDGTPPRGKVGYWTDGTRVVTAAVTRAGRRLFFESEGDVVRTNVLPYFNADEG
jgi:hypothetical protein